MNPALLRFIFKRGTIHQIFLKSTLYRQPSKNTFAARFLGTLICRNQNSMSAKPMDTSPEGAALLKQIDELSNKLLVDSEVVRQLRADSSCDSASLSAKEQELKDLNKKLKALRVRQKDMGLDDDDKEESVFDRNGVESLLKRRFFFAPAFEIYGGVGGLYDYGPPGCAVKNNLTSQWREHFVVAENMLELEASALTPMPVLKASGHVDKFADLLVKDSVTMECFRADHLLKEHLDALIEGKPHPFIVARHKKKHHHHKKEHPEQPIEDEDWIDLKANPDLMERALMLRERVDEIGKDEMTKVLEEWKVRNPENGNKVTEPYEFNLMFSTSIGPSGMIAGFLRPETAQGIFVNFRRLLDFNGGRLPMAVAQIGSSFRNEISPKAGLLRVREFTQAEIEHFVNPDDKDHVRFKEIADLEVILYPRRNQLTTRKTVVMKVGDAVSQKIIDNETLGYFIAKTSQFVQRIGMNMKYVRFRQHLEHEMAHYAKDCWDLEICSSYGWVECAGLADRSAFDLKNHSKASGVDLTAREVYEQVKYETRLVPVPDKPALGKVFKKQAQEITQALSELTHEQTLALQKTMTQNGKADIAGLSVDSAMVTFREVTNTISGRNYHPSVIEPSFGIGRLLYCLFEHVYYVRQGDDEMRAVLALQPILAPIKVALLPLSKNEAFDKLISAMLNEFRTKKTVCRVDDSGGSIGRRYSRADEIGTPFGITVDFVSLEDETVTLRERDSTTQVRGKWKDVVNAVIQLSSNSITWQEVQNMPGFVPFDSSAQESS